MKKFMIAIVTFLTCTFAFAQAQPSANMRLRGTLERFDGTTLVLKERSGETHTLALADNFAVTEVLPIELSAIRAGSYIGTAAMPQADGTLGALAVTVFPESSRGVGDGHSTWDLRPGSTMTNGTVANVVVAAKGHTLTVRYKDGEKTVVIPEGTAVVTFQAGERSLLVPGAKVTVTAQLRNGQPTALRAQVGRAGVVPPA